MVTLLPVTRSNCGSSSPRNRPAALALITLISAPSAVAPVATKSPTAIASSLRTAACSSPILLRIGDQLIRLPLTRLERPDVGCWHKTDITTEPVDVRYWG